MTPERPPPGESQANDLIDEAGKGGREITKVMKERMGATAHMKVEPQDVILQWVVRWAAMLQSRFQKGINGKTEYQRQKGMVCKVEVIPF